MPKNSSLPYPIPSLFASQKLFIGSSLKGLPELESSTSPTSTLESKHFSSPTTGLGGLVDILQDDDDPKTNNRPFLIGSQLKIQLPTSLQSNSVPYSPPQSPIEFGIKTRGSLGSPVSCDVARPMLLLASISPELLTDIELSEDYTCVISHGPNPKTTHIFDNCIVHLDEGKAKFARDLSASLV